MPRKHNNPVIPNAPALSYFDSMRLELRPARLACQMQADEFASWLDEIIQKAPDAHAIRAKTAGSDWTFFADRWHCLLCLSEQGVKLKKD